MNAEQWSTIRDIRNWAFLEGRESWGKHINLLIDENAALTAERATLAQQLQQAQQQGETALRWAATWQTWGEVGFPAAAAVAVACVGGWAVVEWQRSRTRRHEVTEGHTTQRLLITAKRDIALAYIAMCGDPGARQMRLGGVEGVYLPSSNELVPIDVCRAELALAPAQRRMITMEEA